MNLKTARSILALLPDNDFKQFLEYLKDLRGAEATILIESDDELKIRTSQGKVRILNLILDKCNSEKLTVVIEKLNKTQGKTF
jgi:hypothetical protein